MPMKIWPSWRR